MDFRVIRPIRGSANNGFEELCCQLAAKEAAPAGSRFVRNGTPDGGVEGYRIHPDGGERAWQAKYFFEIESSQWAQLRDSITTALDKHPALTRYTICLPIDLPDARVSGQESLRQKWERHVAGWETLATARGMTVRFDLWGARAPVSPRRRKTCRPLLVLVPPDGVVAGVDRGSRRRGNPRGRAPVHARTQRRTPDRLALRRPRVHRRLPVGGGEGPQRIPEGLRVPRRIIREGRPRQ